MQDINNPIHSLLMQIHKSQTPSTVVPALQQVKMPQVLKGISSARSITARI